MPAHYLKNSIEELERHKLLRRISETVDGDLELAEIQRQNYAAGGPALFFESVNGSGFPVVCNLFGNPENSRFIFGKHLEVTKHAVRIKSDPSGIRKLSLKQAVNLAAAGIASLPKKVSNSRAPVLKNRICIEDLPKIKSWPDDGGHFITLPQVYSEDVNSESVMHSNLGMYRIQLDGNDYKTNEEIGLHYQTHRSIGVHHAAALEKDEELKVSIFIGGHPAHTLAAIMPLPEGLSELVFAGMLSGRRFRYTRYDGYVVSADADFCILGTISREMKPEGPFGDHLGYYSLKHDFPVMKVRHVFHRDDAIWPHTVVGRPPQEDTTFGKLIHEITEPMVPKTLPGVKALHAVDAAGVHPLMLAIGSERYTPYSEDIRPKEILTQANAILGFGQCSLAKYLIITDDHKDVPDIQDIQSFISYVLERIDFRRDLHFYTETNMDTLDYSGSALNHGSKLVIAVPSLKIRNLSLYQDGDVRAHPDWQSIRRIAPGILAVQTQHFESYDLERKRIELWIKSLEFSSEDSTALVVLTDDAEFIADNYNNFLWEAFTRTDPARDVHGINAAFSDKHWGCDAPMILDARRKPHHAPDLKVSEDLINRAKQKLRVNK